MKCSRKFPKTLVGDFITDIEIDKHRHKFFLARNMKLVLERHESHRAKVAAAAAAAAARCHHQNGVRGSYPTGSQSLYLESFSSDTPKSSHGKKPQINGSAPDTDLSQPPNADTARDMKEQIAPSCLVRKTKLDDFDAPHRRSQRGRLSNVYNDHGAELMLEIRSIRKKLNWTPSSAKPTGVEDSKFESPPRKRARRGAIPCHCHVTVWDNRTIDSPTKPLVVQTEKCHLTRREAAGGPAVVNIDFASPICIKAKDLEVDTTERGRPKSTGIGDKYFLEIKIVPAHDADDLGDRWPPMPVLSRSEAELFSNREQGKLPAEALHGALLAKYVHLPNAPERNVPLSLLFLYKGSGFKTKFGVEVSGEWMRPSVAAKEKEIRVKNEPLEITEHLDPVFLDEDGRPFGRKIKQETHVDSARKGSRHSFRGSSKPEASNVEVAYIFDPKNKETSKASRTATLKGFCCPACRIGDFDTLSELRFHLINSHHKYKFDLLELEETKSNGGFTKATIAVNTLVEGKRGPRELSAKELMNEFSWNWERPQQAFDIDNYVKGDQSWVGKLAPPVRKAPAPKPLTLSSDPTTALRQKNGGFLPVSEVQPLPDYAKQRKKYKVVPTRTVDRLPAYGSVTHWPLREDSENLSETDEEDLSEGNWMREKHLATLRELEFGSEDGSGARPSKNSVEFMVRWDGFRMSEGLFHPKYLADTVVRFCRAQKTWLKREAVEELAGFLTTLKARRVVDEKTIAGCWAIVFCDTDKDIELSHQTQQQRKYLFSGFGATALTMSPTRHKNFMQRSPYNKLDTILTLPPGTCGHCHQPIPNLVRGTVHCSDPDCEAPSVFYHMSCAKVNDRNSGWRCALCCGGKYGVTV